MTDPVLDTIDNVLHDYEVSGDAMRWTPEPQPSGIAPRPSFDAEAFAVTFNRFADAYKQALRTMATKIAELAPVINRAFKLMQSIDAEAQVRRSAMHSEYHRRQKRRSRR